MCSKSTIKTPIWRQIFSEKSYLSFTSDWCIYCSFSIYDGRCAHVFIVNIKNINLTSSFLTQLSFTCSKSTTEAPEQCIYLFKGSNKNTCMTSLTSFRYFYCKLWTDFTHRSDVSIVDFEQANVGWEIRVTCVTFRKEKGWRSQVQSCTFKYIDHLLSQVIPSFTKYQCAYYTLD